MNLFKTKYRIVQETESRFRVQERKWNSIYWKNDHCVYSNLEYARKRKNELIETDKFRLKVVG